MAWADDMQRDALAIAAPDFELRDDDEIHLSVRSCDGEWLSSVTFEDPFFAIDVDVWRPTTDDLTDLSGGLVHRWEATGQHYHTPMHRTYLGDEAREFLLALMKRGGR